MGKNEQRNLDWIYQSQKGRNGVVRSLPHQYTLFSSHEWMREKVVQSILFWDYSSKFQCIINGEQRKTTKAALHGDSSDTYIKKKNWNFLFSFFHCLPFLSSPLLRTTKGKVWHFLIQFSILLCRKDGNFWWLIWYYFQELSVMNVTLWTIMIFF